MRIVYCTMQPLFVLESLRMRISDGNEPGITPPSMESTTEAIRDLPPGSLWRPPPPSTDMRDLRASGPLERLSAALRRLLTPVLLLIKESGRSLLRVRKAVFLRTTLPSPEATGNCETVPGAACSARLEREDRLKAEMNLKPVEG